MTFAVLEERLSAAPFMPVTIHLEDGRFFHIEHPDFAPLLRTSGTLVLDLAPGRIAYIDIGSINTVETTDADASA